MDVYLFEELSRADKCGHMLPRCLDMCIKWIVHIHLQLVGLQMYSNGSRCIGPVYYVNLDPRMNYV